MTKYKRLFAFILSMCMAFMFMTMHINALAQEGAEIKAIWDEDTNTLTFENFDIINSDMLTSLNITSGDTSVLFQDIKTKIKRLFIHGADKIEGKYLFTLQNLEDLTITDVGTIGEYTFYGCNKLATVNVTGRGKDSDSSIELCAFRSCCIDSSIQSDVNTSITINDMGIMEGNACSSSGWKKIILNRIRSVGNIIPGQFGGGQSFAYNRVEEVIATDVGTISGSAFNSCSMLKEATLTRVGLVAENSLNACTKLETVNMEDVGKIDGDAFSKCTVLKTISGVDKNTQLGYFDRNRSDLSTIIPGLDEHIAKIMDGRFFISKSAQIEKLEPDEGWTDTKQGKNNRWSSYKSDTQIFEQARWKEDTDSTVAQVQVQAYSTFQKQMDFIFVLDVSGSMIYFGADDDMNAKYYDMNSKVQDISNVLLIRGGDFDSQVAFVTFSGTTAQSTGSFYSTVDEAKEFISNVPTPSGKTPYDAAMSKAKEIADQHSATGRNTSIVLISDGYPEPWSTLEPAVETASEIKELGVTIFGVIQSIGQDYQEYADYAMQNICTDGRFFSSHDTESFSDAVNDAVSAAYGYYTVSVPIGDDFNGASVSGIKVSDNSGSAVYNEQTNSVEWQITGAPFATHTLNYEVELKKVDEEYPYGKFDTNSADAVLINSDGISVNNVQTPQLPRERKSAQYSVVHEYYTNGKLDATETEEKTGLDAQIIKAEDLVNAEHGGKKYEFDEGNSDVSIRLSREKKTR